MKYKSLGLTILLAAFAGSALAQNQGLSTIKCDKPDKPDSSHSVEIAGHVLILEGGGTGSCTFSVPTDIAGLKATAWGGADTVDVMGAKFQVRGYGVTTVENGDKAYLRFQGAGTVNKEGVATSEGTWSYIGGTGKLKGLKGKGTYKASGPPNGATEIQIQNESSPEASATAKKK